MKKYGFIIFLISIFSCGNNIYFDYYQDNIYATIEVKNNNRVIYRGVNPDNGDYIYIFSNDPYANYNINDLVSISEAPGIYYLKENEVKYRACILKYELPVGENKFTYQNKGNDSLRLRSSFVDNPYLVNQPCFKKNNITWFPPYLKKVKKIDYSKFGFPKVKDKYLKNPEKAPEKLY